MIKFFKALYQWSRIQEDLPEDRPKRVFRMVKLLGNKKYFESRNKFFETKQNVELLKREKTLSDLLENYKDFKDFPLNSLGKEYYNFMQSEEVDYAKFVAAHNEAEMKNDNPLLNEFDKRERNIHDLVHIIFGYTRSRFGEGATLVTQYWQGGSTGLGAIMLFGVLRTIYKWPSSAKTLLTACKDIYKRQKNIDFRSYPFEDNLLTDINEIRKQLKISPPSSAIQTCERFTSWSWKGERR